MRPDIKSLSLEETGALFERWKEPRYRRDQLLKWLYEHRVLQWEDMTNLPEALRRRLHAEFELRGLEQVTVQGSRDTTRKFLWRLQDGLLVESVLIPANPALYGEASDRHTACLSTQVGCAYGCKFCASGLRGWKRDLTPDEIVEQVLSMERWNDAQGSDRIPDRAVNNIVVMGMGEPLANYDNLLRALRILNHPDGGNIGARKITLSTSGLAPQIERLAREPEQFRLAVSLHGATDEVRERIMPVNRKYPLATLMAACESYQQRKGRMITLEYILIDGVNDSPQQADLLAGLARKIHAKVNLIPYNPVEGLSWRCPSEARQDAFAAILAQRNVPATLRREKGRDIDAACGQLRLKHEEATQK